MKTLLRMNITIAASIILTGLALTAPVRAGDTNDYESFEVTQTGPRAYRARGSFVVPATTSAAWGAIADYEGIPRIAPSVKVSRLLSREGNHVTVEHEAVASVLFFSKRVRLLLQIEETPPYEIAFRDVAGDDFTSYVGFWTIEERSDSVRVSYGLDVERGFAAPDFLAKPFFRKQSESLMRIMREEILRRAGSPPQKQSHEHERRRD